MSRAPARAARTGSPTQGPLGTGTITIGSVNQGYIALLNSSSVAVTLANPMSIIDACSYLSVSGMTFTGPVTLNGSGQGTTNNGVIDLWLGTNNNITFSGQITGVGKGLNLRNGYGSGGLTLSGSNNSYTGPTSITMGTLIAGGNAAYINSPGVFGSAASPITIGDANSGGNPAALVTNGPYIIGRAITVNATAGPTTLGTIAAGTSTYSGAISLGENVALSAAAGGSALFTGAITGAGGITAASTGNGNVSILSTSANTNTYSGATTVSSGQLTLDYSGLTPSGGTVGGLIPDSHLTLGGGTLAINGNPSAAVNDALLSTSVANFGSTVVVNLNGSHPVQVALGPITRSGGLLNIANLPAGGTLTTTSSNTNGILGGYLTVNDTNWAAASGGTIGALAIYATNNYTAAGNNVDVTNGSLGPTGSATTVNSLRFNTPSAGNLALGGSSLLTLASGGILVTPNVGNNSLGISGGSLTSSSGTTAANSLADVAVIQANTSAPFTINSAITNNGGTAVGLTKGGAGTLT